MIKYHIVSNIAKNNDELREFIDSSEEWSQGEVYDISGDSGFATLDDAVVNAGPYNLIYEVNWDTSDNNICGEYIQRYYSNGKFLGKNNTDIGYEKYDRAKRIILSHYSETFPGVPLLLGLDDRQLMYKLFKLWEVDCKGNYGDGFLDVFLTNILYEYVENYEKIHGKIS